jgi:hypothetical protein
VYDSIRCFAAQQGRGAPTAPSAPRFFINYQYRVNIYIFLLIWLFLKNYGAVGAVGAVSKKT